MNDLETVLLVTGVARVIVWSIGVAVCRQIGSRIGVVGFGMFAGLAALNTLRDAGVVSTHGIVAHVSQGLATPAAAVMVATLILNHREGA